MSGDLQRRRWSEGRGPRRTRTDAARAGHRAGQACHRRRSANGRPRGQPSTSEVGAVCGKAARTVLWGGALSNGRPYRIRYPRWSRGSPRFAIRAEETGRIGVRFKSLQERWIRRPRADAVEAFEQLALGVQGFALTAPKGIPIPRWSRCDRLPLFGDRRKAHELPRLLREDVLRWRERIRTLGPRPRRTLLIRPYR